MTQNRAKILGLTGGIASGKSSVSEILRTAGGFVFDADKIAHSVIMKGGAAYGEVISAIDGAYVGDDGQIDRGRLGAIVFEDSKKREALERIVHRHVIDEIMSCLDEKRELFPFVVIDAPLLFESGLHKCCDSVWIVVADYYKRLLRLVARNGLTKEQAEARIRIQLDWENIQNCGYIFINNNGSFEELSVEVSGKLRNFLEGVL